MNMTKKNYGTKQQNLDTTLFRKSIGIYLEHIHGLRDDGFDYGHVNKTLNVS